MYEIEVDKENSIMKIIFTMALTIQNSMAIKEVLSNSLSNSKTLIINHDKVSEFDLTYLQLLLSLHKSAESIGKSVIIDSRHSESFIKCVKDSGLPLFSWFIGDSEQESNGVIEND